MRRAAGAIRRIAAEIEQETDMNCSDREILGRCFDGELPAGERAGVEEHLRGCAACRAEFAELATLAGAIAEAPLAKLAPPEWSDIAARLNEPLRLPPARAQRGARGWAAAAALALLIGLAGAAGIWLNRAAPARAAVIDFTQLLDAVNADAVNAFDEFLAHNHGARIEADTVHAAAPRLDFEVPAELPGGYTRKAIYRMKFGDAAGIAASYRSPDGEFLATIFHPPVRQEQFGTHQDYPCVIGDHHGHAVKVGAWRMIHLTDPSTCHCVLTRSASDEAVAAIFQAIAPRSTGQGHDHGH